jgi:ferredoxin
MGENDIVCDVDLLYQAIGNHDAHDADLYVHETALKLKNTLLDIIRDRDGGWGNAYVVSLANTDEQIKENMKRINADKCVFIDTPIGVCMERAKERPQYFKWLIQEWFATKGDIHV